MTNVLIDYSQIHLQENIPLDEKDIRHIANHKKDFFKDFSGVVIAVIIIVMLMASYFLQNEFKNFKYYHYILFFCSAVALYLFFTLVHWLLYQYFKGRWKKDLENGKNRLSSIVISRHKTENDEYMMTFAGRHNSEKIRLPADKTDYYRFEPGTKVVVTYFKYSKEILSLESIDDSIN